MNVIQSDVAYFEITPRGLSVTFVVLDNIVVEQSDCWSGRGEVSPLTAERSFSFLVPLDSFVVTRGRVEFCSKAQLGIDFVFPSGAPDRLTADEFYAALMARRHEFPAPSDPADCPSALNSTADLVETALHRICAA